MVSLNQMRHKLLKSFLMVAFMAIVAFFWSWLRFSAPVRTTGTDTANPLTTGDPEAAMHQARRLMTALQAVNFDKMKIPRDLLVLPDHKMHEFAFMRNNNVSSFGIPNQYSPKQFKNVAFTCDLYARKNVSYYKGDKAKSRPEGFYIVGWKDGRIEKVSVWAVRMVPYPGDPNAGLMIYPGMAGYNPNGKLPAQLARAAKADPTLLKWAANLPGQPAPAPTPLPTVKNPGPAISCPAPTK